MKNKVIVILSMIIVAVGLTGCNKSSNTLDGDVKTIETEESENIELETQMIDAAEEEVTETKSDDLLITGTRVGSFDTWVFDPNVYDVAQLMRGVYTTSDGEHELIFSELQQVSIASMWCSFDGQVFPPNSLYNIIHDGAWTVLDYEMYYENPDWHDADGNIANDVLSMEIRSSIGGIEDDYLEFKWSYKTYGSESANNFYENYDLSYDIDRTIEVFGYDTRSGYDPSIEDNSYADETLDTTIEDNSYAKEEVNDSTVTAEEFMASMEGDYIGSVNGYQVQMFEFDSGWELSVERDYGYYPEEVIFYDVEDKTIIFNKIVMDRCIELTVHWIDDVTVDCTQVIYSDLDKTEISETYLQ